MTRGRIETTPAEQLIALQKARDQYVALADRLRDSADAPGSAEEKALQERDARRIADSYEKSIANMVTGFRNRETGEEASRFGKLWMGVLAFSLVMLLAIAAFLILGRANVKPGAVNAAMAVPAAESPGSTRPAAPSSIPVRSPSAPALTRQPEARPAISPPQQPPAVRAADSKGRGRHRANTIHRPVSDTNTPSDSGFVVKVIQPDGSLREEIFPPSTSLR
jgi:hypothetical protein